MKEVIKRVSSPTPSFFVKLRNIGLVLASMSAAILTAPIAFPGVIITVAGYAAVVGSAIGAVSQLVKKEE
jgi:hypothetical protein